MVLSAWKTTVSPVSHEQSPHVLLWAKEEDGVVCLRANVLVSTWEQAPSKWDFSK